MYHHALDWQALIEDNWPIWGALHFFTSLEKAFEEKKNIRMEITTTPPTPTLSPIHYYHHIVTTPSQALPALSSLVADTAFFSFNTFLPKK